MKTLKTPLLILALPLLVGCAGDSQSCEPTCGTAIIIAVTQPDAVVHLLTEVDVGAAISDQLFVKLAELNSDLATVGDTGFVPELATSWSFEDSVTIAFHLNPAARWHDGEPVTSRDVEFTFDAYRDTLINSIWREDIRHIRSVTVRDDRTVAFTFTHAYPEQFYDATHHMRIIPAHVFDSIPRDQIRSHPLVRTPVGGGPYRFVRWVPGESVELRGNPDFFLGKPGIGRLIWQVVPDPGTGLSQLLAGEADIMEFLGPPANIAVVDEAPDVRVYRYPAPFYYPLALNFRDPNRPTEPHPLFADSDIRRAITMAIDRDAIVASLFGDDGAAPPGPMSQMLWIWSDDVTRIPHDPERASRLLAARGWRDTDGDGVLDHNRTRFAFELINSPSGNKRRAAVIIQEQLRQIGIEMNITQLEFLTWVERSESGRFDATFLSPVQTPSPSGIRTSWGTDGPTNYGRYSSPLFDRLVDAAINAGTATEALELWHQAMAVISEDAPAVWVMTPTGAAGISDRYEDVVIRPDLWAAFLWQWKVARDKMISRDLIPHR